MATLQPDTVSDLFDQYARRKGWNVRHAAVVEGGCALCGAERPLARLKDVLGSNFTDHDIWRFAADGVCTPCQRLLMHGRKGAPFVWAYTSWGHGDGLTALFPWSGTHVPWYTLPAIRPLVAAVPGKKYEKKHYLFRAQVVWDERLFGLWHGDADRMVYAHMEIGREIGEKERAWRKNGYPDVKEIYAVLSKIKLNPYLRSLTERTLFSRRKKFIADADGPEGVESNGVFLCSFQNPVAVATSQS